MKLLVMRWRVCLGVAFALALGGCLPPAQSQLDEEKEPYFLAGMSRVRIMDFPGAIDCFERALRANPRSAAAHEELGWLFEQKVSDPAAAIYHYQRFLRLRPQAEKAEFINQHIQACKQELAATVSLAPVSEKQERELEKLVNDNKRLVETNKLLSDEVTQWRVFYAARPPARGNPAPAPLPAGSGRSEPPVPARRSPEPAPAAPRANPAPLTVLAAPLPTNAALAANPPTNAGPRPPTSGGPAPARTCTVRAHETLAMIARRCGVRLEALQAANPGASPRRLRPGQVLNLP